MIKYLGISIGMHAAALVAVFSVASLPRTDVLQSEAGDTVTLTFHGNVNPHRQVVETVDEELPEDAEMNPAVKMPRESSTEAQTPATLPDLHEAQVPAAPAIAEQAVERQSLEVEISEPIEVETVAPETTTAVKKETVAKPSSASSVSSVSGGHTTPARNVRCPAPPFPERARRFRVEGQVRVSVHIGENGRVREVDIVESSGRSDFDRAARATILKHWRYQPAFKWGQSVSSRETVLVEFRLQR